MSKEKKYVSKRTRVKTVPFELGDSTTSLKRKSVDDDNDLLYERSQYLAVRNDQDGYYICRTLQNVYEKTKKFGIQWLEQNSRDKDSYDLAYTDRLDSECVLTNVTMKKAGKNKYSLAPNQKKKIEKALGKSIRGEDSSDEEDEDDEEDESDEEPPKKKAKLDGSAKKTKKVAKKSPSKGSLAKKGSLKKTNSAVTAAKTIKKRAVGKAVSKGKGSKSDDDGKKGSRASKKQEPGKKTNKKGVLVPRSSIKVLTHDPFLESKEKVPFVSSWAHSKLLLRAAFQNDMKLLKELIADLDHVARLDIVHSETSSLTPLQVFVKNGNLLAANVLIKELFNVNPSEKKTRPKRVAMTATLLAAASTGQYNKTSLHGVPFVRRLNMSRGSKEGNNAFTKDLSLLQTENWEDSLTLALNEGVSKTNLDKLCAMLPNPTQAKDFCYNNVVLAVRMGHRKLAAALMDDLAKSGMTNFNFLHRDVLAFDNEDLRIGIRDISVKKKPFNNSKITPLHCAAINPNPKYLIKLLSILPDYNIMDGTRRRPIHYAVVCEKSNPLEVLLQSGVNPAELDSHGHSPLFLACLAGRACNVELLLSTAKKSAAAKGKASASADDDDKGGAASTPPDKFGLCLINMPISYPFNKYHSYTPLHLVANTGNLKIAHLLVDYGADVNKELSANKNKLTPFMVAASCGRMDMMRMLLNAGAKASQRDKLKRTPMMLAAMNGQAHVITLLLNLGCSPDDQDSSGNTALHYAAAYGWYFCVKVLIDAGANPNLANDWKTTPLGVAFLKGHIGLGDILLEHSSVDINFRLDGGLTLVHTACCSHLQEGIVEQLEYLVIKKKADCSLVDDAGANALHHLAQNNIKLVYEHPNHRPCPKAMAMTVQIAKMLIQNGCDVSATDSNKMTPLMLAVQQGNRQLVELLLDNGAGITNSVDKQKRNILHILSEQCMTQSMAEVLTTLHKSAKDLGILSEMAKQVDDKGMTPLIRACLEYRFWNGVSGSQIRSQREIDHFLHYSGLQAFGEGDGDAISSDEDDDEDGKESENEEEQDGAEDGEADAHNDADDDDDDDEKMEEEDGNDETQDPQTTPPAQSMSKAEKQALEREAGRKYIYKLLEVCGAGADIPLQKQGTPEPETDPEKEANQYFHKSVAGFSAVHFLVGIKNEQPLSGEDGSPAAPSDQCPGLTGFLKCLTKTSDAEMYNHVGRTPLLEALAGKQRKVAQKLIEFGVDVNAKSRDAKVDGLASPLIMAAKYGLHDLIPILVQHGADVSDKDSSNQYTALHYVVKSPVSKCFKHVVEVLIKHKTNVTAVDKLKKTALHLLVEFSRDLTDSVAVAGLLLDAGSPIDGVDSKGRTPLHLAINANAGDANCSTELEQFLLDKGANQFARDWLQRLPLHYVFVKIGEYSNVYPLDPVDLCSLLTSSTNKPSSMVNYGDQFGLTPLHVAARRGASVCCIQLIKKGSNVNGKDSDGNTPLAHAIANKHESCTIMLLQHNANISGNVVIAPMPVQLEKDEAIDDANKKKEEEEKEKKKKEKPEWKWKLVKPVAKPPETKTFSIFQGVISHEWQGITFMMLDLLDKYSLTMIGVIQAAFRTRKYHLARTLIRKARGKNELTVKVEHDQNLAHVLALSSETKTEDNLITTVAQMLLDRGVSFISEDEYGCTPLHYACLQGNKPLVTFMLGCCKNFNVEKKDKQGRTALAAAFWKLGQNEAVVLEIVKALTGATLNTLCSYPYEQVDDFGHKRTMDIEDYHSAGASHPPISPLMLSILHNNFSLTRGLIEIGADVNFPDNKGRTPLMVAVYENKVNFVRLLIDHQYVVCADEEDDDDVVQSATPNKKQKNGGRKVFALGRQLQKLPSIEKSLVCNPLTGKKSQIIIVNGLNMSSKTIAKKSNVNEKALDSNGRSVLHYLIHPLPYGSYDNYRLLQQLVAIGAPLQHADNDGKTVLDYAVAQGLTRLTTAIQYLNDRNKGAYETPKYASLSVNDGITWKNPIPDFVHDSDKHIEKFEQDLAVKEDKNPAEYNPVPDPRLADFATGQVISDTDLTLPYDVLLTKIDVAAGQYGLYNFYKMQIIHQKGKDLYVLFTRWGRIGDSGQFQQTPFPSHDDAVKEFRKIFRSKTGNEWPQVKSFEPKPRKYRLVPWDQRIFGRKSVDIPIDFGTNLPSKLHPYVQDMIKEMTDMVVLADSMDRLGFDRSIVPLGRIRRDVLVKAKDILIKLKGLIASVQKVRANIITTDMDKYGAELEKIAELTNEYYHLLPKKGFEYDQIPILDQDHLLQTEWKNIETLMELEIASKIIIGAQHSIKDGNPLDYVYRCLRCQINLMDENDMEAQYLLRYVNATWDGKVEAIYRVARDGEEDRLASCGVDNHRLLFHGSSSSNLISILSKGLLISPPDAPRCGNAFGNGIYAADRFAKSHAYCYNYSQHSNVKFMLVCEVALGKTKDLAYYDYQEKVPTGYQSVRGVGQKHPDPQFDLTLSTGAVMPLGGNKTKTRLGDNHLWMEDSEFIVYKENQVCIRYIIQFAS